MALIKENALKILNILYNKKTMFGQDEICSEDKDIINLNFTEIDFKNAISYLKDEKYIKIRRKLVVNTKVEVVSAFDDIKSETKPKTEKKDPTFYRITSKAINILEDDSSLKRKFGQKFMASTQKSGEVQIKNQSNDSKPIVKNVSHEKTGSINYGNIVKNTFKTDNSVTYSVHKEDNSVIENISVNLTKRFDEKKLTITGAIAVIAGVITILTGIGAFLSDIPVYSWIAWLALIPDQFLPWMIGIGIFLLAGKDPTRNAIRSS